VNIVEELTEDIADRIGRLPSHAQVALLICAAAALAPGYARWREAAGAEDRMADFRDVLQAATAFATAGEPVPDDLLLRIFSAIPDRAADDGTPTTVFSFWLLAATAVQVAQGTKDGARAAPQFLSPSVEALLATVGSSPAEDLQEFRAQLASSEEELLVAHAAVVSAADALAAPPALVHDDLARATLTLMPILP
jgi:hypothetical protein